MTRTLSFRTRLTVRWTVSFGLLLAAANVVIYVGSARYARQDVDAQLVTLASTEVASAIDEYRGVHLHEFEVPKPLSSEAVVEKFAQVLNSNCEVLLHSPSLESAGPLLTPAECRDVLRGSSPVVERRVAGKHGHLTALPAGKDGKSYIFVVGLFTDRLERNLGRLRWLLLAVWGTGLVLTATLGNLLAASALLPVDRITQRAATIAKGDFRTRLDPPEVLDEIGRMTRLLNQMLDRLHGAIEANRRFASDASHELRGPLTAMMGEVDVTLKRPRLDTEYREALHTVRKELAGMSELTENLMLLARIEEQQVREIVKEVPLGPLLEEPVARLRAAAEAKRVRIELGTIEPAIVYGDSRLLSRVFENVLANSIQYNREGGRVKLDVTVEEATGEDWKAGQVEIRIADSGIGVPLEDRDRIFERFTRLDRARSRRTGGTGLGLAIAREIVGLFGGRIRVAESSAEGSVFAIVLPGRRASAARDFSTVRLEV